MPWGHAGVFLCGWNGFWVGLWRGLLKAPHMIIAHTLSTCTHAYIPKLLKCRPGLHLCKTCGCQVPTFDNIVSSPKDVTTREGGGGCPRPPFAIFFASQVALVVKNLLANVGDVRDCGFSPWVGKIPWRRAWAILSSENPMDRGAWWATVHGVAKSRTPLKHLSTHAQAIFATSCESDVIST